MTKSWYRGVRNCWAIAVLPVLLAGCVTTAPYVAPANGPTARLLLRSHNLLPGKYVIDTFDDAQRCSGPRNITEAASGKIDSATSIRADQPVSLRIQCSINGRWGHYVVTFDAKSGHKYDVEPFSDKDFCGMVVFNATSGERVLEPSARRRGLTSYIEGGLCASAESYPVISKRSDQPKLDDLRDLLPDDNDKGTSSQRTGPSKPDRPTLDGIRDLLPDADKKDTNPSTPSNPKERQSGMDDLRDLLPKHEK